MTTCKFLLCINFFKEKILGITGDYFRPVVPGSYQIAVEADSYVPAVKPINVPFESVIKGKTIVVNFKLKREQSQKQEEQFVAPENLLEEEQQEYSPEAAQQVKLFNKLCNQFFL